MHLTISKAEVLLLILEEATVSNDPCNPCSDRSKEAIDWNYRLMNSRPVFSTSLLPVFKIYGSANGRYTLRSKQESAELLKRI